MASIDWVGLGFGALWVFGLSLNLAALSWADYERWRTGRRLRDVWGESAYQVVSNFGLVCFCIGLLGSARTIWERIAWGGLAAAFAVFAVRSWRMKR
jgi:hypothetical protein